MATSTTTSQKHDTFVRGTLLIDGIPKALDTLPGIGPAVRTNLEDADIPDVTVLLGHFLVLQRDSDRFIAFLGNRTPAIDKYPRHRAAVAACLSEWCNLNL